MDATRHQVCRWLVPDPLGFSKYKKHCVASGPTGPYKSVAFLAASLVTEGSCFAVKNLWVSAAAPRSLACEDSPLRMAVMLGWW